MSRNHAEAVVRPEAPPAVRIEAENEWAWCGSRRLTLTPRVFAVLRHLVEHSGRLITKDELLSVVWRGTIVSDAAVASSIRDLRRALEDSSGSPRYIQTVHRRGFRFIGPVGSPVAPAPVLPTKPATGCITQPSKLVGREVELARLHRALARALEGQRQLVFVTGEAGIGKTALVEAFLESAADTPGLRVGRGQCVAQYGAGEPYLPVFEALGRLGRAPATHGWMLRELADALDALAQEAPLALLLEDLHWSDSSTIELLGMLARRRDPSRLLILGTYRAGDVPAAGDNPMRWVKHELQLHGYCDEIALEFWTAAEVDQYLAGRFPGHALPPELAGVLHRSTEGNPLFLVSTVDDLIDQGRLRELEGRWGLVGPVEELAARAPETLWQLVETQLDRLTADEQEVLVAASVAGVEFSAALTAAAGIDASHAELRCAALARRGQFLRVVGEAEWPDGTVAERYAFIHALYQQVLYARVSVGARAGLHLQAGERLERGYGDRAGEIAAELAVHFERGRDTTRAARYRGLAGEQALRHHGYREAAEHAARGLDAVAGQSPSRESVEQELRLQITRGAALTATKGYAAPDVARTYARAWELCGKVGSAPDVLPVLRGVGRYYLLRGDLATAHAVAARLMMAARDTDDVAFHLAGENALGVALFYAGEFEAARAHLERGLDLFAAETARQGEITGAALVSTAATSAVNAALALWALGYPARSAARAEQALALARGLGEPFSVSYACHLVAGLGQWRGDSAAMQALEEEALPHDTEHGFGLLLAAGLVQRGWVLVQQGQGDAALDQMRQGVAKHREIGAAVLVPHSLVMVAEAYDMLGRPAEGLAAVTEGLAAARQCGRHYWEAELHRLMGALTLRQGAKGTNRERAEACFLQALEVARHQGARALELRAAVSLGRLWAGQGKARAALALISPIYASFTEGWDTLDLLEGRRLRDALREQAEQTPERDRQQDPA